MLDKIVHKELGVTCTLTQLGVIEHPCRFEKGFEIQGKCWIMVS